MKLSLGAVAWVKEKKKKGGGIGRDFRAILRNIDIIICKRILSKINGDIDMVIKVVMAVTFRLVIIVKKKISHISTSFLWALFYFYFCSVFVVVVIIIILIIK